MNIILIWQIILKQLQIPYLGIITHTHIVTQINEE